MATRYATPLDRAIEYARRIRERGIEYGITIYRQFPTHREGILRLLSA